MYDTENEAPNEESLSSLDNANDREYDEEGLSLIEDIDDEEHDEESLSLLEDTDNEELIDKMHNTNYEGHNKESATLPNKDDNTNDEKRDDEDPTLLTTTGVLCYKC
jgi:hypothetical protein